MRPGQHSCLRPWFCVWSLSVSVLLHPCLYQTPSAWTLLFCDHRWLAVIALGADCLTASQKVWSPNVVDIASTVPDVDQVDTNVFAPAWQVSFKQWRGAPEVVRLLPCGNNLVGLGVLLQRAKSCNADFLLRASKRIQSKCQQEASSLFCKSVLRLAISCATLQLRQSWSQ